MNVGATVLMSLRPITQHQTGGGIAALCLVAKECQMMSLDGAVPMVGLEHGASTKIRVLERDLEIIRECERYYLCVCVFERVSIPSASNLSVLGVLVWRVCVSSSYCTMSVSEGLSVWIHSPPIAISLQALPSGGRKNQEQGTKKHM